ncbi:unnamed protein product [Effrenium voratum]|nr:unnamed protein product [Effrenium voratum]
MLKVAWLVVQLPALSIAVVHRSGASAYPALGHVQETCSGKNITCGHGKILVPYRECDGDTAKACDEEDCCEEKTSCQAVDLTCDQGHVKIDGARCGNMTYESCTKETCCEPVYDCAMLQVDNPSFCGVHGTLDGSRSCPGSRGASCSFASCCRSAKMCGALPLTQSLVMCTGEEVFKASNVCLNDLCDASACCAPRATCASALQTVSCGLEGNFRVGNSCRGSDSSTCSTETCCEPKVRCGEPAQRPGLACLLTQVWKSDGTCEEGCAADDCCEDKETCEGLEELCGAGEVLMPNALCAGGGLMGNFTRKPYEKESERREARLCSADCVAKCANLSCAESCAEQPKGYVEMRRAARLFELEPFATLAERDFKGFPVESGLLVETRPVALWPRPGELRADLARKGGTTDDWNYGLNLGLIGSDLDWIDARAIQDRARSAADNLMSKGAYLEYECYDARGRSQGRAVVKIRGWADPEKGLLEADHLAASDGYYQYYGESELSKGKALYHICGGARRGCNVHLHRGDRRELVHLERWRMINPLLMKEVEYLRRIAEVCMREHVVNFAPRVPEPVLPPRGGDIDASGIDKAVAEAAADDADYEGGERRTEEGRLQVVPQGELWRLSQRHPGRLLKSGMKELERYLADRAGEGTSEDGWAQHKVMAYINQVILAVHPMQSIGLRNHRELVTLGTSLDLLMNGRLAELGDLLMQRLKALETSLTDQNWSAARHQELIPPVAASLTTLGERHRTARAELQQVKLKEALQKHKELSWARGSDMRREEEKKPAERESAMRKPRHESEESRRPVGQGTVRRVQIDDRPRQIMNEKVASQRSAVSSRIGGNSTELLDVMREWLRGENCGELTTSQSGALLVLMIHRSGTNLGNYLEKSTKPGSVAGEGGPRQRSLMPLPLWTDVQEELKKVLESGEYKRLAGSWAAKKQQKQKAAKAVRRSGLLIWHGLVVILLNHLWTGGGNRGRVHQGSTTLAQQRALERLWEVVKVFCDDASESKDKIPKSPSMGEWGNRLGDVKISYTGEIVDKAHKLTLAQVLPGLPPEGYGASVPLAELCEGELRERLEDPLSNLLPEEELPEIIPKPRTHADQDQWEAIVKVLHARGLVEPVEDPVKVKGLPIENGAFGVVKPGKYLEDERPVLRFIMDFRATNSVSRVLTGDVKSLTGAASLQHIVLPEGKVLRMSADDLVAAFYLFALPRGWSRLMCFGGPVAWKSLGYAREGRVRVGATVLPMGWASAVGVLQHAHRRLALRSPLRGGAGFLGRCEIRRDSVFPNLELGESLWSLYLDDTDLIEIMDKRLGKEMEGKNSEEQLRLRRAYEHWGIPISLEKALVRAKQAEKLGAVIDGDRGLLRAATRRALESLSLGAWMLRQEEVPRKALQVFCGKEVHTMQFRRPTFGIFDYIWKDISDGGPMVRLEEKSVEEILMAGMSQPLRFTDLRAKLHEVVTASDACETGGGMVYGGKLSAQGIKESLCLEGKRDYYPIEAVEPTDKQTILVFDCFAGIGGLSQALKLAGVEVNRLVVIEMDSSCRRLNLTRWPGCEVMLDIQKIKKSDLEKVMRSVPGLTGVITGGGSPCQGLSRLSSNRQHLDDPRSALFYKFGEVLRWVSELAAAMKIWDVQFVENVVGDDEDISEMSGELNRRPIYCCASGLSRVRRPRLYWCNVEMGDHESFGRGHTALYDIIEFNEKREPLDDVIDAGWEWPAGKADPSLCLPTFTRAIPRTKPPAEPAGLRLCDQETVGRWKDDLMKYPPYTYQQQYLMECKGEADKKRVASVTERERLMGYPAGYTLALHKKDPTNTEEEFRQQVAREAAIGNSFHAVKVACLLDLWLWTAGVRTDPKGASKIVEEWHQMMRTRRYNDEGLMEGTEVTHATSLSEKEEEDRLLQIEKPPGLMEWLRMSSRDGERLPDPKLLAARLVHQYLRRAEFRGSDVRLDLQVVYRPDAVARTTVDPRRWVWKVAHSYKWDRREHINVLELRAILHSLEWRARSATFHSCRFLRLSDSQICLAVLAKGRSSSRKLNRILRKIAALCIALNLYPLWAWIASKLNPADEPSRRYEPKDN